MRKVGGWVARAYGVDVLPQTSYNIRRSSSHRDVHQTLQPSHARSPRGPRRCGRLAKQSPLLVCRGSAARQLCGRTFSPSPFSGSWPEPSASLHAAQPSAHRMPNMADSHQPSTSCANYLSARAHVWYVAQVQAPDQTCHPQVQDCTGSVLFIVLPRKPQESRQDVLSASDEEETTEGRKRGLQDVVACSPKTMHAQDGELEQQVWRRCVGRGCLCSPSPSPCPAAHIRPFPATHGACGLDWVAPPPGPPPA